MEIVATRPKQFADRRRAYKLHIDGKLAGKIEAGQEIRLTIPQNSSILQATIDWCSSNTFDLSTIKENEKLEILNAISKKAWIPFYLLYAITARRKKYLSVKKVA